MQKLIAIDPGLSGGVALFDQGSLVDLQKMPTRSQLLRSSDTRRKRLCPTGLAELLRDFLADGGPALALVEVQFPKQNGSSLSALRQGEGYGVLLGALGALGVETLEIRSSDWKGALGLGIDKQKAIAKAREIFPGYAESVLKTKSCDGPAEAALIGYWASINLESHLEREAQFWSARKAKAERKRQRTLKKKRKGPPHSKDLSEPRQTT